jgi:hypothetical protein
VLMPRHCKGIAAANRGWQGLEVGRKEGPQTIRSRTTR